MFQVVLFGFIGKGLVVNQVALEIFAVDSESILAQVVTVAKRAIWCDQECPVAQDENLNALKMVQFGK